VKTMVQDRYGSPDILRPQEVRLGYGLRRLRNRVPGLDLAGVVEAVGRAVTRFAPGDEVFGTGAGAYAEYAVAPEHKLAGNRTLSHLRRALTPKGTLVLVGGEASDGRWLQGFDRQLRALLLSPFIGARLVPLVAPESAANLDVLRELIEAGEVTPVIDRTYPLVDVADAIRRIEDGHARGKLVITI
jgi:NADPH:quinone reductase-like Zn-dependent oxidoreductase